MYMTLDKTKDSLEHVFYEIQSLFNLTQILNGNIQFCLSYSCNYNYNQVFNNIFLENTLIHCRCLIDFFEIKDRKIEDDILYADYGFDPNPLELNELKKRIHKELAHLSYSRKIITDSNKIWNLNELINPLFERCVKFINHILASDLFGVITKDDWQMLLNNINDKAYIIINKNAPNVSSVATYNYSGYTGPAGPVTIKK
jgi:hypothetical protein